MTKSVRAYFKTEDDLLSAEASLRKLHIHDMWIDEITNSGDSNTILTAVPPTQSFGNFGFGLIGSMGNTSEEQNILHVLEGKVQDQEYQKAVEIIQANRGILQE